MTAINKATALRLASFIERLERLAEEKKALAADEREVMAEEKAEGFDAAGIRAVIAKRRKDPDELRAAETIEDTYIAALGVLTGSPLGEWAREQMAQESEARVSVAVATHDAKVAHLAEAMGLAPAE